MFTRCAVAAVVATTISLTGCARKEAPQAEAPQRASVLDIMSKDVDPSADFIWESVATISTEAGIEERHPRTDEEWKVVRDHALKVIEGAKLLQADGLRVAHPGQKLSEPGGAGDFTPEQSQAAIDADHSTFVAYARALEDTAGLMLAAIDKKSPDEMLEVGGALDEACEQCHVKFWYPNSPKPPGL